MPGGFRQLTAILRCDREFVWSILFAFLYWFWRPHQVLHGVSEDVQRWLPSQRGLALRAEKGHISVGN